MKKLIIALMIVVTLIMSLTYVWAIDEDDPPNPKAPIVAIDEDDPPNPKVIKA